MTVWTLSLLQFVLVLTSSLNTPGRILNFFDWSFLSINKATMVRHYSLVVVYQGNTLYLKDHKAKNKAFLFNLEVAGIIMSMVLQDAPFLAVRLFIIFGHKVHKVSVWFFAAKNALVIFLELYR